MSEHVPACIGMILDGNRRWAKERGLPTLEGHRQGMDTLMRTVGWLGERGIGDAVVFAFSSENWQRSPEEVGYLLELMADGIVRETPRLKAEGVRVRVIGDRARFPENLQAAVDGIEHETAACAKLMLWVCLSYGARAEIVAAAQAARGESGLTEESFVAHLWSAGMPDPDLIIRTGGRHRLSNFLLWQAAYSELFFSDTLWPDFSEQELDAILAEFAERTRTFGV